MKPQFSRHLTYAELKKQCKRLKVPLDDRLYCTHGYDSVVVGAKNRGYAIYNTFSGRFFGVTDRGVEFSSDSTRHDKQPWMKKLLNFFYVE